MVRTLIAIEEATLSFGPDPVFADVNLAILEGDVIGLIGHNGSGKTSLMKVITNEYELDSGARTVPPHTHIGYLRQTLPPVSNQTLYQYLDCKPDSYYIADQLLEPLDLVGTMSMQGLSGGQLRRLGLAQALIEDPDLLLLDEPTNHLDIDAILWLESYLKSSAKAALIISHDRQFLRNVTNKTFLLFQSTLFRNNKGFADYDRWMEQILREAKHQLNKQKQKLKREEHWLIHGVTARRKRNQERLNKLHTLREASRKDSALLKQSTKGIALPDLPKAHKSKLIIELENISKAFNDNILFTNISLRIMKGDRIAIIGPNGSGKTTFLETLLGIQKPSSGKIRLGPAFTASEIKRSYFDQFKTTLDPNATPISTLCPGGGDRITITGGKDRHVIGYLKDFLFDPDHVRDKVSTLSGGQGHRLLLARILANPGPLLVLDEPTNDLDMDTLDHLEDYLSNYPGTILMVSHDRDFIDQIATQTLAFDGKGNIEITIGGYSDLSKKIKTALQSKEPSNKKDLKKTSAIKPKLNFREQYLLTTLPDDIKDLEKTAIQLETALSDPNLFQTNQARFTELSQSLALTQKNIADKEQELFDIMLKEEAVGSHLPQSEE